MKTFQLFQMISCAWCDVKQFDKILIEPSNWKNVFICEWNVFVSKTQIIPNCVLFVCLFEQDLRHVENGRSINK